MFRQLAIGAWATGMAFAGLPAHAQSGTASPGTPPPSQHFVSLDANGDGALSRAELGVIPELQRGFEDRDRNKDGTLSMLEFSVAPAPEPGTRREPPEPVTLE